MSYTGNRTTGTPMATHKRVGWCVRTERGRLAIDASGKTRREAIDNYQESVCDWYDWYSWKWLYRHGARTVPIYTG